MQRVVGHKWYPVVLYYLLHCGPQGFNELERTIDGISSTTLSESLKQLEAEGLVTRAIVNEKPFRVEYSLTASGEAFEPLLAEMIRWAKNHLTGGSTTPDP